MTPVFRKDAGHTESREPGVEPRPSSAPYSCAKPAASAKGITRAHRDVEAEASSEAEPNVVSTTRGEHEAPAVVQNEVPRAATGTPRAKPPPESKRDEPRIESTLSSSGARLVHSAPTASDAPRSSSYPRPRYLPILPIADGGMANVELAVGLGATNFKKLVVLKTLRQELAFDPDLVAMFLSEARLCARLNHANLVHVYEVLEGARPCMVMEYLEGLSMFDIHRILGQQFERNLQLRMISDVLAGLHYAHELRDFDGTPLEIVHRDVSPQNVVITSEGRVKVLDFGIAKMANVPSYTQAGIIKGKMSYMAPEQLSGEPLDRRTDVFAVGCMLWRAATGTKLWAKMQPEEIMRALILGNVPAPSLHGDVDPRLESIVVRATAPDRNERYATAAALQRDLDEYLASLPRDVDLGTWMQNTFAEHWVEKRRSIGSKSSDATSLPPLELERRESVSVPFDSSTRPRLLTLAIVTAAVGLLLIAAIAIVWRLEARQPAVNDGTTAVQATREIVLRVRAEPPSASINVDGVPLSTNPGEIRVVRGSEHLIEVSSKGFKSLTRKVHFEREANLEFALVADNPASAATPSPTPAAPQAHAPANSGNATVAPKRNKKRTDCSAPFYFKDGIKIYKPECL